MKRVLVTFVLDTETVELLRLVAEQQYDGNRSMTVRRLIRNAAKLYGVSAAAKEDKAA
jgi:hypothetical protein